MAKKLLQISFNLSNINDDMHQFWQCVHQYRIIAFSGEMGAGKTTFIHHLCEYLKVEDAVSSPTFSIINEYHFNENGADKIIFHMDWYRLNSVEEAIHAGIEDALLQSNSYSLVEWPEKAYPLFPKPFVWVTIETLDENTRKLTAQFRD